MNSTLLLVITAILSAFFIFASSIKIFGWQKYIFETQLEFFNKYGLNRAVMAAVGCGELFGALAIWLPGYIGAAGALVLAATSAGAICCHLYFDTWKDGIPAMVTLMLSSSIWYSKYLLIVD